MSFCGKCGGYCVEISSFEYSEGGVSYSRKKMQCQYCGEVETAGQTKVIDEETGKEI